MLYDYEKQYLFTFSEDPLCPIKVYKQFRYHRPVECLLPESRFYLGMKRDTSSPVWFKVSPPLGKTLCQTCAVTYMLEMACQDTTPTTAPDVHPSLTFWIRMYMKQRCNS